MNWKNVKELIGGAAPMIGTALAGPAGTAIGTLVSSALGVENNPDAVAKAIQSDPDALLKLKQLETDNAKDLRANVLKMADIELKDVQNARDNNKHSSMPAIICCSLTGMVALGAAALFTLNIPPANEQIANLLFGALLAKWGDSIAFWVGTSRSSAEKTRQILK